MSTRTAHVDTFTRDNLPPRDQWPEFRFSLPELRYPPRLNCAAELLDRAVAYGCGPRPALLSPGGSWTYRELLERSNKVARVLTEDLGLVPGNRVLIRSANNPMMAACWLGTVKAGGVAVATMPLLRARELAYIIDKAEIEFALCDHRLNDELALARAQCPRLRSVLRFGDRAPDSLESAMATKPPDFTNVDTAADDVCLIGFTSGTTGVPKGAMHFHRDMLAVCDTYARSILQPSPTDVFCGAPSLAFAYGLGALLLFPLRFRSASLLLEKPTPEALLEAVQQHKATILFAVPILFRTMLPHLPGFDVSSLRACVSAGEHLPVPTFDAWKEATGLSILDGIGSTELLHIFVSSSEATVRPGSTGKPVSGYNVCILDERGRPAPPGGIGRLSVRGPTGCLYLADERQGDYVHNGWNITGDTYRVDEQGYFWYQARTDDMIVTSGNNVSGPEVEAVLSEHPHVAEAAVIGIPDVERGTVIKAVVVLSDGIPASEALARELQEFVKRQIAPYKYPRIVEFALSLPRTETGKLQRYRLRPNPA